MRKKTKKFLSNVILLSFVVLFIIVVFITKDRVTNSVKSAVTKGLGFHSTRCTITGRSGLTQESIVKAAGFSKKKSLMSYDQDKILEKLLAFKQVEHACVRKNYPHTLKIYIKERKPVAQWFNKGSYRLVDRSGVAFLSVVEPLKNMLVITGKKAPQAIGSFLEKFAYLQPHIEFMHRIDNRRWNIVLKNGYTLQLPEDSLMDDIDIENLQFEEGYNILDLRFFHPQNSGKKQLIYKKQK